LDNDATENSLSNAKIAKIGAKYSQTKNDVQKARKNSTHTEAR
jgi:hypothetical protein